MLMNTGTACIAAAQHAGPHRLDWMTHRRSVGNAGDPRLVDLVEVALAHADIDVDENDTMTAAALVRRARQNGPGCFDVNDAELGAVERALRSACDYMNANDYAGDADFAEDAAAAHVLGECGTVALICWATA